MRSNQSQRRNRMMDLGVIMLVNELFNLGFDAIPPVTLVTIVGQILLFVGAIDVPWDKGEACLSGKKVWQSRQFLPLILSTFEHGDDMHLYYNMISFLVKGRSLEARHGTANFGLLLAFMCILTPVFYVALAVVGSDMMDDPSIMKSCAIGFSGVIFALKVLTTVESGGETWVAGMRVPVKYSAWAELLAIHILVPNASFLGHLAGILAGLVYMKTPIGSLIDSIISSVTGQSMGHGVFHRANYESSAPPPGSYYQPDYGYGFRREYQSRPW